MTTKFSEGDFEFYLNHAKEISTLWVTAVNSLKIDPNELYRTLEFGYLWLDNGHSKLPFPERLELLRALAGPHGKALLADYKIRHQEVLTSKAKLAYES